MTMILSSYTPKRAAELAGFDSVAMLDYLQRTGVFFPQGSRGKRGRGRERKFTFRDVLTLKAIRKLLESGASVLVLKRALDEFQKYPWAADPATLEDNNGPIRYFVASSNKIYLAKDANVIIGLSERGQLAFSFIIDLDTLHTELCQQIGVREPQPELKF